LNPIPKKHINPNSLFPSLEHSFSLIVAAVVAVARRREKIIAEGAVSHYTLRSSTEIKLKSRAGCQRVEDNAFHLPLSHAVIPLFH
jgi:hypothetical protein